jgi:S1-C subfamily serine protease
MNCVKWILGLRQIVLLIVFARSIALEKLRSKFKRLVGGSLVAANIVLNPNNIQTRISEGSAVPIISYSKSTASAAMETLQSAESQTISIFEDIRPSVVFINTYVEQIDIFSMNVMEVAAGTGSGFVWDNDGHIVTNYHVIRNAGSAKVRGSSSRL